MFRFLRSYGGSCGARMSNRRIEASAVRTAGGAALALALLVFAGMAGTTAAKAATIQTLLDAACFDDSNCTGERGGAVYFNLQSGKRGVTLTGLSLNTDAVGKFKGLKIYVRRNGGHAGFEDRKDQWELAAEGELTARGRNVWSPVALNRNIFFPSSSASQSTNGEGSYGLKIVMPKEAGHAFTQIALNGSKSVYQNPSAVSEPDIKLNFGRESSKPFTAPFNTGVTANIRLDYELGNVPSPVPLPAAAWLFLSALGVLGTHRAWAGWRKRAA